MNKNWVTISLVLATVICLVVGIEIMYETKAFWGKESNSNINTINCTMNTIGSTGFLPLVIIIVVSALVLGLLMTTRSGFG